ncbi:BTAD domain-containing putative transcriptional regulator [Nonomuraea roseoviolacea subsp. roseoviolacea]
MDVDVGILGPLEVTAGATRLELGGPRRQIVLALLTLEAGRLVPVDRLIDAVYGSDPPPTARVQVQICVSALRRLFAPYGDGPRIATRPEGYLLRIAGERVDLRRFEDQAARGRDLRDAGRPAEAVASYRSALAQWRGPALHGLDGELIRAVASRLDEQRAGVLEDRVELELELGRHRDLIPELTALAERHPLRERPQGLLMLALYRSERQADALEVYRRARRTLVDQLGIEPSAWLQRLERDILTRDPRLGPPPAHDHRLPAVTVPRLLPTDIADFTGRRPETAAVERHLTAAGEAGLAVPLVVVSGRPGVGKTTLAVHVAHRLTAVHPDGQLFVDLRGHTIRPVDPMRVLERFLRVLGVPGTMLPGTLDERAEMYRHLLSGRRILVVLDNAGDEGQVVPLLPGTPPSAVLVTSRSRLAGLPRTGHVEVGLLDAEHAVELLSRVAGAERVREEPEEAAALAGLCGRLPLALRVAGARLATRPHWTLAQLVERMENETRRLDELDHGGLGIRASFSLTYEGLGPDARRLFRRLALPDFPLVSGWAAAALLDRPYAAAQDVLDTLADAHLVEIAGEGRGLRSRYRLHDLIKVFARERLTAEEPEPERDAALERVLGALLFLTEEAHRSLYGDDARVLSAAPRRPLPGPLTGRILAEPMEWLERERGVILAGVRQAAQAGHAGLAWDLAESAVALYEARVHLDDWRETHAVALEAARRAGDRRGEAVMLASTGSLHIVERRFGEARRRLEDAAGLFRAVGDDVGEALAVRNIAFVDRLGGRPDDAASRYARALETFRRAGDLVSQAYVLQSVAVIELERGDAEAARRTLAEALDLTRRGGSRRVEAQVLYRLGETYLALDRPDDAAGAFADALAVVEDAGDPIGRAFALCGLAAARLRRGRLEECAAALDDALRAAVDAGDRLTEARALLGLGELDLARGEPARAAGRLRRALGLSRGIHAPALESRVLALLAQADGAGS